MLLACEVQIRYNNIRNYTYEKQVRSIYAIVIELKSSDNIDISDGSVSDRNLSGKILISGKDSLEIGLLLTGILSFMHVILFIKYLFLDKTMINYPFFQPVLTKLGTILTLPLFCLVPKILCLISV